jgi:hypothetical protein
MRQFTQNECVVFNWVIANGSIAEPANDVAKRTCEDLRQLGYLEFHPADKEKRFSRYIATELGRQTLTAFFRSVE